uniref:Apoptosis inducing factor mitochondria associated 5 n=1 Tax=Poecilia latipinna TaxID=48699 RepID=A0A3B3V145_9TELE
MMEVDIGRHSVLLTRCDGKYSAISNQCSHYGAPLSKGVISGHKVRCPWHGSCFNALTGDLEEFPGIDSLPCHKVKIQNSKVYVSINKKLAASLICAETLRQENYGGRIIMASRDDLLPYDKTRLSKVMNVLSGDTIVLRKKEFFQQYNIEVWLQKEALSVDTEKKTVTFDDGLVQSYDQLLLSTGCRAKGLDVPGRKLDNIKMLETPEDARQIHAASLGCNIVLVGTSFVMEVASYMIDKASSITVVGSSDMPYQNTLGREVGKITMMMLLEKGVRFYMNDHVTEIKGVNGKVKEVVLKSGNVIPADVLIVGIGSMPNSEFLQGTKIQKNSKNYVVVDKYMRTNVPDVFCAGDLASFPLALAKNQLVNIGHWQMAQAQRIAALNMLKKTTELTSVPYYWTVLQGRTIRYAYGEGYTEIVMKGNYEFEERKFLANDEVIAAVGLDYDPVVSAVAERLLSGKVITKKEA